MKKLICLFAVLSSLESYASCAFTNANVVYVSPNGNDSTAIVGCMDQPFLNPVTANSYTSSGWTLVFLPGYYNLSNTIPLQDGETVLVNEGANLINWVILTTNYPLFMISNNVTMVINGTISDGYAPGSSSLEQAAIGAFTMSPHGSTASVATNVLITGHGSIFGSSECISFETTNACSGRIENLHVSSYHSTLNFIHGGHTFAINGVTASVLPSSAWSNQVNQVIYALPDAISDVSHLLIKDNTLFALAQSSPCYFDYNSSNVVTFINNYMVNDGTTNLLSLFASPGASSQTIQTTLGGVTPADISTIHYRGTTPITCYNLELIHPYPVLPQVSNLFTLPSLGLSNMVVFNYNGTPTIAWSGAGGTNTYSAPLTIGTISTNPPGLQ